MYVCIYDYIHIVYACVCVYRCIHIRLVFCTIHYNILVKIYNISSSENGLPSIHALHGMACPKSLARIEHCRI